MRKTRKPKRVRSVPLSVGIDHSLTGTAVAVVESDELVWVHGWTDKVGLQEEQEELLSWYKSPDSSYFSRIQREVIIRDWVLGVIDYWRQHAPVVVAIEGYAFGKRSTRSSDLYEVGGSIRMGLWDRGIPLRIYGPETLKKAWTGNGHADKPMMMESCRDTLGADFHGCGSAGDDLTDATLIAFLLYKELAVKQGVTELEELDPSIQYVMKRSTKAEPIPLTDRPFIAWHGYNGRSPVYGPGSLVSPGLKKED